MDKTYIDCSCERLQEAEMKAQLKELMNPGPVIAALRAENERLKARGIERMQHRIAELEQELTRLRAEVKK